MRSASKETHRSKRTYEWSSKSQLAKLDEEHLVPQAVDRLLNEKAHCSPKQDQGDAVDGDLPAW